MSDLAIGFTARLRARKALRPEVSMNAFTEVGTPGSEGSIAMGPDIARSWHEQSAGRVGQCLHR